MEDEKTETYGAVKPVKDLIDVNIQPTTNSGTNYADDGPAETATSLGDIQVAIQTTDVPKAVQADWFGHTIDEKGVLIKKSTDKAPYIALGFKSLKANNAYRYVWLLKGKMQPPQQQYHTKEDNVTFQNQTINGTFIRRNKDDQWQAVADDDDQEVAEVIPTWFDSVYGETPTV